MSSASAMKTDWRRGVVVKGASGYRAEQGSDYQPGVSAETVGSKVIWLGLMTLPPGARTKAHVHEHHETALYMMSGDLLELWTGDELEHCNSVRPGELRLYSGKRTACGGQSRDDTRCIYGITQRGYGAGERRPVS